LFECRLDFTNRAHGGKITNRLPFAKSLFLVQRKDAEAQGKLEFFFTSPNSARGERR
jgi:hypothetical protein